MPIYSTNGPVARADLVAGVRSSGTPVPLKSERMRVTFRGGLALVSREQTFRNDEAQGIEATLTFPVPVHATLHALIAVVGDRTLSASARVRTEARNVYEKAVDEGKTAVLHEELLRGIHMLSIAHIPPGKEVTVTHSWISTVSPRGDGKALLRIPVTVGDVYGDSPFNDGDDLAISQTVIHRADIEIDCGEAHASIVGAHSVDGKTTVLLDAPVDIEIEGLKTAMVAGKSADGRSVTVSVVPEILGDADVNAAIVVDRSGSMSNHVARSDGRFSLPRSKAAAVIDGLAAAATVLRPNDRTELWQFDNESERLSDYETPLAAALDRLGEPRGGTEIGAALDAVVATSKTTDVVLITDGLSHALDVQKLLNTGRRFTVILVGEDSFEANVGRLAALSGGQIFLVTNATDAAITIQVAIGSLRWRKSVAEVRTWPVDEAAACIGGMLIEACWRNEHIEPVEVEFERAVGAFAAAIALPALCEQDAIKVAADHQIVCHLTSLVLVDELGKAQEGLPAQRKIPLMAAAARGSAARMSVARCEEPLFLSELLASRRSLTPAIAFVAMSIDWTKNPEALRRGDFSSLAPEAAELIIAACSIPEVVALVGPTGDARAIVIALIAQSVADTDRAAERIARAVLSGLDPRAVASAMIALGL